MYPKRDHNFDNHPYTFIIAIEIKFLNSNQEMVRFVQKAQGGEAGRALGSREFSDPPPPPAKELQSKLFKGRLHRGLYRV